MGRLILLVAVCLVVIGGIITFNVPLDWIGHLPGDFSYQWGETRIFVPIITSLVFSAFLAILLFLFSRR